MLNDHFKGKEIDDTPDDKPKDEELEDEDGILNLKTNSIPKGMVELECIFDQAELVLSKKMGSRNVIHTIWVLIKILKW